MRVRLAAAIIDNNKLLLIHRKKEGREYWVFPGGGLKEKESYEEGIKREVKEETGLEGKPIKLLYKLQGGEIQNFHPYYLCQLVGKGKLKFTGPEKNKNKDQVYKPEWVPIQKIAKMPVLPEEIKKAFLTDLPNNFTNCPRDIWLKS